MMLATTLQPASMQIAMMEWVIVCVAMDIARLHGNHRMHWRSLHGMPSLQLATGLCQQAPIYSMVHIHSSEAGEGAVCPRNFKK